MANPATLLLALFRAWNQPNDTADNVRQPAVDGWVTQRLAVKHIDAIEQLLREMEQAGKSVAVYRNRLPQWQQAVFVHPGGWVGNGTAKIDSTAIDFLEALAGVLDDYVPKVVTGGIEQLRSYVSTVREALDSDESIPATMKLHIRQVISHLEWCIDHYEVAGDFELQIATERLAAVVVRATGASNNRDRWRKVYDVWVWPFAVNMLASIPSAALAHLTIGS